MAGRARAERWNPAALAAWVRGHWHIENKLQWVCDVTYQKDKSLVRTGNAPRVMASLRTGWRQSRRPASGTRLGAECSDPDAQRE